MTHERVSRREAQLDAILDNSSAVIWLKDRKGRYMLINRRFEEVFHMRREDAGRKDGPRRVPRRTWRTRSAPTTGAC